LYGRRIISTAPTYPRRRYRGLQRCRSCRAARGMQCWRAGTRCRYRRRACEEACRNTDAGGLATPRRPSSPRPNPQAPRVQEPDDDLIPDLRLLEGEAAQADVRAEEEVPLRGGGDGQLNEVRARVQADEAVQGRGVGGWQAPEIGGVPRFAGRVPEIVAEGDCPVGFAGRCGLFFTRELPVLGSASTSARQRRAFQTFCRQYTPSSGCC